MSTHTTLSLQLWSYMHYFMNVFKDSLHFICSTPLPFDYGISNRLIKTEKGDYKNFF